MSLPLQPTMTPWLPWQRRLLIIGIIFSIILLLGLLSPSRSAPMRFLESEADSNSLQYIQSALRVIDGAEHQLTVVMYVVRYDDTGPVAALLQSVAHAHKRGVAVRVVLDQGRDWNTGEPDSKHKLAEKWLTDHGVPVFLDELDRTTHAKVIVADGRTVILGSHNWTRYALAKNREWSLQVDDPDLARSIEARCATIPGWK